jgi:exopolysaccharide biosynthesis polyprenyl glycosylphosphotransferase
MHTLLFVCFCILANNLPPTTFSFKEMVFALIFSAIYFLLIWNDLYSRPYHHYLKHAFFMTFRDLCISSVALLGLECVYAFSMRAHNFHAFIRNDALLVIFYFGVHILQYIWIVHLANLGFFRKNVMLVGTYDERMPVENLYQNVNNTKNFVGQIAMVDGAWQYRPDLNVPFSPIEKNFSDFLFSKKVNELIICLDDNLSATDVRECAAWCLNNSIGYYLIPNISLLPRSWPWQNRFDSIPAIERYCPNRDSLVMISLKRVMDILVSFVGLVVLSPVMLAISILVKREDGGKVFYVSDRVGIHGKIIRFVKFRSMVPNAEALKKELLARNERPDGPLFKLTNDPRVTKIGKFLRDSSLDEIPQLWNVLKGDMSLIGPRPHLPSEVKEYSDQDNLRLECIPGISCLPQIFGRDTLGFREWVDYDLKYRKEWSLFYDCKIFVKTIFVVLKPLVSH